MSIEPFSEPTCFLSYSWDDKAHMDWVRRLASDLQERGVRTRIDQWDSYLGMDLPGYMEESIRRSDFVILICTPEFAEKANTARGAVGYEKTIVTGALFRAVSSPRKFIPILRRGDPETSFPFYLLGKVFQDFREDRQYEQSLRALLRHIHNQPEHTPPPIGPRPNFYEGQGLREQAKPRLPWRAAPPPTERDVFRLLDWRVRLTPLIGRDDDLRELLEWAGGDEDIRVRFLVGPGGAGKSRLAFEALDVLRAEGWGAKEIHLDEPHPLANMTGGVFRVVDYPEAHRRQLRDLLRELARAEQPAGRVRVLLLSRLTMKEWNPLIDDAGAAGICDAQNVRIGPLEIPKAVELFGEATRHFAAYLDKPVPSIGEGAVEGWLNQNPETHPLPLFIVAAALHCALDGGDELSLTGGQIVQALVRRERKRLNQTGRQALRGEKAASRVVGLATVSGSLDAAALRRLVADGDVGLPAEDTVDTLESLGFWHGHGVPAPSPDIVAAELLFTVLEDRPDKAAEWLWACLADMNVQNVDRLGRIAYDVLTLRGQEDFRRFTDWLASVVRGRPERAQKWRAVSEEERLPLGVLPLAVTIGQMLLENHAVDDGERARLLHTLSNRRLDVGDKAGAFEAGLAAVSLYEKLAAENPPEFEPAYARGLMSLSICLRDMNNRPLALEAGREAVNIWRRLAAVSPERHDYDLARSLHVLSICISESGPEDREQAIESMNDAVGIWRGLAATNPARYEPGLAQSLNALSLDLSENQDAEAALRAVNEAVGIWRGLAAANPARYEQDLAMSLGNLAYYLHGGGDEAGAMKAINEAVKLYERAAAANPTRYESHLARNLDNLSNILSSTGNSAAAVAAFRHAVDIWRRQAAASPDYSGHEVRRLERLFEELGDQGRAVDTFEMLRIAEKTVTILLIRGARPDDGAPVYAYVAVRADRLESFMEAHNAGTFYPEEFGAVVASGEGEPSAEVKEMMETEYGFNHAGMVDIPGPEKGREIVEGLTRLRDDEP